MSTSPMLESSSSREQYTNLQTEDGSSQFRDLARRVKEGDARAAEALIHRYEAEILRAVRFRLRDQRLRRLLDSTDLCQSILGSFFVRAYAGEFQLDGPEQLRNLLARLVRNKVVDRIRRERAERRDYRRTVSLGEVDCAAYTAPGLGPAKQVELAELVTELQRNLTRTERELLQRRRQGQTWDRIGTELGDNPENCRKRLSNAIARAARKLGIE